MILSNRTRLMKSTEYLEVRGVSRETIAAGHEQIAKSKLNIAYSQNKSKRKKKAKEINAAESHEHIETLYHLPSQFWENTREKYHASGHQIRQERTSLPQSKHTFLTEIDTKGSSDDTEFIQRWDVRSMLKYNVTKKGNSAPKRSYLSSLRSLQYLLNKLDNEDIRSRLDTKSYGQK